MSWYSDVTGYSGSTGGGSGTGFTGTSTGNVYNVGQSYVSAGRIYTAQADGTFMRDDGHVTVGSSIALQSGQSRYVGSGAAAGVVVTTPKGTVTGSKKVKASAKSAKKPSKKAVAPAVAAPIPRPREIRPGVPAGHQAPPKPAQGVRPGRAATLPTTGPGVQVVTKGKPATAGPGVPAAVQSPRNGAGQGVIKYDWLWGKQAPTGPVAIVEQQNPSKNVKEIVLRPKGLLGPDDPGYSWVIPEGLSSMDDVEMSLGNEGPAPMAAQLAINMSILEYNTDRKQAEADYQSRRTNSKIGEAFDAAGGWLSQNATGAGMTHQMPDMPKTLPSPFKGGSSGSPFPGSADLVPHYANPYLK